MQQPYVLGLAVQRRKPRGLNFKASAHDMQRSEKGGRGTTFQLPGKDLAVIEVPSRLRQDSCADLGSWLEQALRFQRLEGFAQDGARNTEPVHHLGIAWQDRTDRHFTCDDGATDLVDHVGMEVLRHLPPGERSDQAPRFAHGIRSKV